MLSWVHTISLLFLAIVDAENCGTDEISSAIRTSNDLALARYLSLHALQAGCEAEVLAKLYQRESDEILVAGGKTQPPSTMAVRAKEDHVRCWRFDPDQGDDVELWDECCSQVLSPKKPSKSADFLNSFHYDNKDNCYRNATRMCCDFYQGSSSYLRLPVLRDLALRIHVQTDEGNKKSFDVQQEGFLRLFDPAGILWPTGYFLALCVSAPTRCGVPELYQSGTNVLELGAGVGLPSIALAQTLLQQSHRLVVATDKALHGLALTATNAAMAGALVETFQLDHYNMSCVKAFRQNQGSGFNIIMGSALQALFAESTRDKNHHLWKILDVLLDDSDTSLILLAHTIYSLEIPEDGIFRRLRTISGNQFEMKTRWDDSSDFKISVIQRTPKKERNPEL